MTSVAPNLRNGDPYPRTAAIMQSPHHSYATRATLAAMDNGILDRRIMRENSEYPNGAVLQISAERGR
jgi:hypothetical protein